MDVQVGDFDGDGQDDLAGRHADSGTWFIARADDHRFSVQEFGKWDPSQAWGETIVGDFNGDGKADLAARNQTSGDVQDL